MNRNNAVYAVKTEMFTSGPKNVSPPKAYLASSIV